MASTNINRAIDIQFQIAQMAVLENDITRYTAIWTRCDFVIKSCQSHESLGMGSCSSGFQDIVDDHTSQSFSLFFYHIFSVL